MKPLLHAEWNASNCKYLMQRLDRGSDAPLRNRQVVGSTPTLGSISL